MRTFSRSYFKREIFSTDRETFGLWFLEYIQLQEIIFIQCEFSLELPILVKKFRKWLLTKGN